MARSDRRFAVGVPELSLLVSIAAFLALGWQYAERLPVWHEVVSALPSAGYRVIDVSAARTAAGPLPLEPSCTEPEPPRLVVSESRPNLGLCAGGQTLPLMVTSYASGISTWPLALAYPLHHDDTLTLRGVWLAVAALSLVFLFAFIRRIADAPTAAIACALTAVSTPFVMINALLLPFETLPSAFLVAALALLAGGGGVSSVGRVTAAGLLVGLSLASNLKGVFFVVPLAALAWRAGARPPKGRQLAAGIAALVLPIIPLAAFAALDPHGGFTDQIATRAQHAADNLSIERLISEPLMLVNFAADLTSYASMMERAGAPAITWVHGAVAIPLAYCVAAGAAHLARRPFGSLLAAGSGVVITTYFFVSLLLYRQYPGGNYSPLSDVFGVAIGAACVDGARWLHRAIARRWERTPPAIAIAFALAAAPAAGGVGNLLRRMDAVGAVPISTNLSVTRGLVAHLRAVSDPDTPLFTTTYNDAGVLDALGHGEVRAIQAHGLIEACDRPGEIERCLREELRWLLTRDDTLPLRVSVPASIVLVDHPRDVLRALPAAVEASASELGLDARVERRFGLPDGTPVTVLYRIEAPRGWTAPASR